MSIEKRKQSDDTRRIAITMDSEETRQEERSHTMREDDILVLEEKRQHKMRGAERR